MPLSRLLQRLSAALMVPVLILPVAAVFLAAGDQLGLAWLRAAGHGLLVVYLPLLFAVGVALGFSEQDGMAALAAVVGYVVMVGAAKGLDPSVDTGVLGGMVMGGAAAWLYRRCRHFEFPEYLALFAGKRFVPLVTAVAGLVAGVGFGLTWPPVGRAIVTAGAALYAAGPLGALGFGVLNRLLIPTGLHHLLNNLVMYVVGSFADPVTGQVVTGEVPRFFARDPTAGYLLAGFTITAVFAVPALCLAIAHEARPGERARAGGIMLTAALASVITGITEPAEFAFMFVAPALFFAHALLTGVALWVSYALGIRHFALALPLFVINLGYSTRPWWLLGLGPPFAAVYYWSFRYLIRRFDLPLVGRGRDLPGAVETGAAERWLEALGGPGNLVRVEACLTRLRLELADPSRVDAGRLRALGALGSTSPGPRLLQVVVGGRAPVLCAELLAAARPADVVLRAPLTGRVVPLPEVPDPVFAAGTVGLGVAIDPAQGRLLAPAAGQVDYVFPGGHALTLVTTEGLELVLHVGLDTVTLDGRGFRPHVTGGQRVSAGDLLVEFELSTVVAAGLSPLSLLLVAETGRVERLRVVPFSSCEAGLTPVVEVWLKRGRGAS